MDYWYDFKNEQELIFVKELYESLGVELVNWVSSNTVNDPIFGKIVLFIRDIGPLLVPKKFIHETDQEVYNLAEMVKYITTGVAPKLRGNKAAGSGNIDVEQLATEIVLLCMWYYPNYKELPLWALPQNLIDVVTKKIKDRIQ